MTRIQNKEVAQSLTYDFIEQHLNIGKKPQQPIQIHERRSHVQKPHC